jgi:hypothetical protein
LYAEFERELPQILGALFTVVSGALANLENTKLDRMPRMGDFARWATAAEESLGLAPGGFMNALEDNRAEAIHEALDADPVGAGIVALMDGLAAKSLDEQWEGTCKDLLISLETYVDEGTRKSQSWPKHPRGMSGRLRRLASFLRESGIEIGFPVKGTKGRRVLTICRVVSETTATSATSSAQAPDDLKDQSPERSNAGGGSEAEEFDGRIQPAEAPPTSMTGDPLNTEENHSGVAKVAVDSSNSSSDASQDLNPYLCSTCGLVEWEWDGGQWVCPTCGLPASSRESPETETERFEL